MKGDTPLDYAVFQLSESQSRCELWICAGERNEKLASGSFKPFLANLRAAKEQIAKSASFIILQAPPFAGNGCPWFTKRTVEMFVRFISTPDVLESVSTLETELLKLVDASSILMSDSSRASDPAAMPLTPRTAASVYKSEVERIGDQPKIFARRSSLDYGGVALDGSKRDLLHALETRKLMLLSEQKKAFAHALAAGFSVACISDLMVFANCFGAPRLWEACLKFMTSCKKTQETAMPETLSPSPSDCSIQLVANSSASEGSSNSTSSKSSKSRSRKTWDPQVMSTLQQLYSRKVENGSFMSPDSERPLAINDDDEDLVVGARESVSNLFQPQRSVEDKRLSVQAAINLFESKQKQMEATPRKRLEKDTETQAPGREAPPSEVLEPQSNAADQDKVEVDDLESILLEESPATLPVHFGIHARSLAVVSEETELRELENIQWKPSSGYTFDDMFLEQRNGLQSTRRQSLCSWKSSWDSDFEVESTSKYSDSEEAQSFFQQYQEKRQARLKHEPTTVKAERDAKLRAMHDVLEKRQAEMVRGATKLSATNLSAAKKDMALRRSSPNPSVNPAAQQFKAEVKPIVVRKSSPGSLKSSASAATTPRLSAQSSCESKAHRTQRRLSESASHSEHGKENVAPPTDPVTSRAGDKKTKAARTSSETHGKGSQAEHRRPKAEVQEAKPSTTQKRSRPLSASSVIRGQAENKLQKPSMEGASSASTELAGMILDVESSCSCATVEESSREADDDDAVSKLTSDTSKLKNAEKVMKSSGATFEEKRVGLDNAEHQEAPIPGEETPCMATTKDSTIIPAETISEVAAVQPEAEPMTEREQAVEFTFIPEPGNSIQVARDETGLHLQVAKNEPARAGHTLQVPKDEAAQVQVSTYEATQVEVVATDETTQLQVVTDEAAQVQVATDEAAQAEPLTHGPDAQLEPAKDEGTQKLVEVTSANDDPTFPVTTMDEVVLAWHQNNGTSADLLGKAPLFELAELDYKMSAATKVPLVSLSSSLVESLEAETTSTAESSNLVGVDKQVQVVTSGSAETAVENKSSPQCPIVEASSEPVSPSAARQRLPLFDLLVTRSQQQQQAKLPCKSLSSSHSRLPHMCRLPSPDACSNSKVPAAQLLHSATHKKLSRSSAGGGAGSSSSGSIVIPENSRQAKETTFKGLKRFLRFGRKGSASSEQKIMWQNGSFTSNA